MNVLWKQLLVKSVVWLFAEALLNFLGLDSIADYSEFIFENKHYTIQVTPAPFSEANS